MFYAVLEKYNILADDLKLEVNNFIDFLLDKEKLNSKQKKTANSSEVLKNIQSLFKNDKGWASESEMIEDMKQFRLSRVKSKFL